MNLERRVEQLEESSSLHETIVTICSNVKDEHYPSPEEQLERQRRERVRRIFIHKFCGHCKELCARRRTEIEEPTLKHLCPQGRAEMKSHPFPGLNLITKYLLRRYKERLLNQHYTVEASRIVDCIDFIVETEKETARV